jgi:hypothetical protein
MLSGRRGAPHGPIDPSVVRAGEAVEGSAVGLRSERASPELDPKPIQVSHPELANDAKGAAP